jgi:hypothetical protein
MASKSPLNAAVVVGNSRVVSMSVRHNPVHRRHRHLQLLAVQPADIAGGISGVDNKLSQAGRTTTTKRRKTKRPKPQKQQSVTSAATTIGAAGAYALRRKRSVKERRNSWPPCDIMRENVSGIYDEMQDEDEEEEEERTFIKLTFFYETTFLH